MRLTNPLEEDPLLKSLLKQLDRIETRRGFAKWKAQFLEQFEIHLEGTNVKQAGQKYHAFAKRLDKMALLLKQLEGLITAGECSTEKCSVKARQSLQELQKSLTGMIEHTEALVPGTLEMERSAGYTKFDMGAVLVRDGFVEYDRLCICNEILLHMRDIALSEVADRQLMEEMDRYWQKVQAFYQIMGTDLGLHGAIMRCREILRAEDDEFFEIEEQQDECGATGSGGGSSGVTKSLYNDSESEKTSKKSDKGWEDLDEKTSSMTGSKGGKGGSGSGGEKGPTSQRFQKVEIYGLDLPLRLIRIDNNSDEEGSVTDLSSVSDYESWCWELELPEPTPKKKPGEGETTDNNNNAAEKEAAAGKKPSKNSNKSRPKPPPTSSPSQRRKGDGDGDDDEAAGKDPNALRYKWTNKDYYHGDSATWRIAGALKKKEEEDDDDD